MLNDKDRGSLFRSQKKRTNCLSSVFQMKQLEDEIIFMRVRRFVCSDGWTRKVDIKMKGNSDQHKCAYNWKRKIR